ncbi:MAG: aminomethyl-transferring glycine dehydrogenase subunit GcvPA [bacterium]|nr:aminomethyl-transferring glycine dehydrogenase subunit GcvPA [bacterium]
MSHPYIPCCADEQQEMLDVIGAKNVEELFRGIPRHIREMANDLEGLPTAMSEQDIVEYFTALAGRNRASGSDSFLAAAGGRHYIPAVVDQIVQRGEFLTSYTPYQPEIAQGTLQAIFEFQSMVSSLMGMEVANAGLYDGATSMLEAVKLALRVNKGANRILLAESLPRRAREVVRGGLQWFPELQIETVPFAQDSGQLDYSSFSTEQLANVAAIVVGYPNSFGVFEDIAAVRDKMAGSKALLISYTTEPLALALYKSPGALGADVAVGDLQSFGVPLSYSGPWCGFMAARSTFIRQMPGRLCGQTVDSEGTRGFVLTLSTREQHIRRDKATSNICTNNQLLALCVTIYLSQYGKSGLKQLAFLNLDRARQLREELLDVGVELRFTGPVFNEFVVSAAECRSLGEAGNRAAHLLERLEEGHGIMVGPLVDSSDESLRDCFLISASEMNTEDSVHRLGNAIRSIVRAV